MSDHKISADGLRIECHAAPNAWCRCRPDCDAESWDEHTCKDHFGMHQVVGGHDCWKIQWVNAPGLEDTYADFDSYPVTPIPGNAVNLINELPDGILWEYGGSPND